MSYIALYRKWRPSGFDEIKGQDAIVTTLRNQIASNRIGHAYLFCGTRGTGKTSAAKVFAKAVNCNNPVNGSPCGECASCKSIAAGNSMNVIEMDAASNNGVDTVRDIRDDVQYSPTDAKYKVYIIDEAHMLTKEACNALLKTLEEPPSYVIFILATTDPHKLPITILSRCQRYDFRRISVDTIKNRLDEIIKAEGIDAEDKAISYIARSAEGGMRDALSLLDQCSAFFIDKPITYDRALEVLGAVDTSIFSAFLRDLVARSVVDAIHLIDKILIQGRDLNQFVLDFTWHLRNVLLVKSSKDASEVVDVTAENLELLKKEAEGIPQEQILRYIRIFSELSNELKFATQKRVLLEIAIIKVCKPQMEKKDDSLLDRIRAIEEMIESGELSRAGSNADAANSDSIAQKAVSSDKALEKKMIEEAKKLPDATKEDLGKVASLWAKIVRAMPEVYIACLRMSVPSVDAVGGKLVIKLENEMVKFLCEDDNFKASLDEAFESIIGKHVEYSLSTGEEAKAEGKYYPPASIFGEDVIVDDSEFEEDDF